MLASKIKKLFAALTAALFCYGAALAAPCPNPQGKAADCPAAAPQLVMISLPDQHPVVQPAAAPYRGVIQQSPILQGIIWLLTMLVPPALLLMTALNVMDFRSRRGRHSDY